MNHAGTSVDPETVLIVAETTRRRDSIALGIVAAVILAAIVVNFALRGFRAEISPMVLVVTLGALFGAWAYSARNARCPSCDIHVGRMIRFARFCPHCGVRLKKADAP